MATCTVCGTDLPAQRGPRARCYCSRACQAKAYRHRQQQRTERLAPNSEQRLVEQYGGVPSRQLADNLSLAALRTAGALAEGQPADEADLGILARIPIVLVARSRKGAAVLPVVQTIPSLLAAPPENRPSRDDSVPTPSPTPSAVRRQHSAKTSRDDSARMAEHAPAGKGIVPRPQKLPKKRAQAVADASELVRDPEHRDNHRWVLRSGDTVLGYVEPSYGGTSRSGRNGWVSRLAGMTGPRGATRDAAAVDLAMRWIRLVTATPKRTITGSN